MSKHLPPETSQEYIVFCVIISHKHWEYRITFSLLIYGIFFLCALSYKSSCCYHNAVGFHNINTFKGICSSGWNIILLPLENSSSISRAHNSLLNACKCHLVVTPLGTSNSLCFQIPHYIVWSERDKFFAVCFPLGLQMYNSRYKLLSVQIIFFSMHNAGQAALKIIQSINQNNIDKTHIVFDGTFVCLTMVK